MNLLVLGGGAQGRVIATDLARARPADTVTVADLRQPAMPALPNLRWIEADASDLTALARLIAAYDLAVGALPSRFGYGAMQAAIDARRNLVDVSFAAEDPLALDGAARRAGVSIAPDCGLAPGLSHLLAGDAYARFGAPERLEILVGGVAQDASRPYGYVVTWSLDDLVEEYTRPARITRGGEVVELPVFAELVNETVDGAGTMESFLSDGLRTLLFTLPRVRDMEEKTLRWPGHVGGHPAALDARRRRRALQEGIPRALRRRPRRRSCRARGARTLAERDDAEANDGRPLRPHEQAHRHVPHDRVHDVRHGAIGGRGRVAATGCRAAGAGGREPEGGEIRAREDGGAGRALRGEGDRASAVTAQRRMQTRLAASRPPRTARTK